MAASLEYVDTSFKPILLFSWRTRDVIEKEKYETMTVAFMMSFLALSIIIEAEKILNE